MSADAGRLEAGMKSVVVVVVIVGDGCLETGMKIVVVVEAGMIISLIPEIFLVAVDIAVVLS